MNDSNRSHQIPFAGNASRVLAVLGALLVVALLSLLPYKSLKPAAVTAEVPKAKKELSASQRAVAAANNFIQSLDAADREKVLYDFGSDKKPNWSNLPVTFVPRNGIALRDLTRDQKAKALEALAAVLSDSGYQKVLDIMEGDQILAEQPAKGGKGKGKGPMFGADLYYLAFFGSPSETKPWMLQFGGHHLGVNVTVIGNRFVLTPTHTGAQPAEFKRGEREIRPLGAEIDAAFKLIESMNDQQRAQAIISDKPQQELLLGPGRDGKVIEPKGIKGSDLSAERQALLLNVISAWVTIEEPAAAAARMAEIKQKIADTFFAWSGPTEKGKPAYFRVQGPTVVIEYAPQGGVSHIHTVYRNPQDDYGVGLLK